MGLLSQNCCFVCKLILALLYWLQPSHPKNCLCKQKSLELKIWNETLSSLEHRHPPAQQSTSLLSGLKTDWPDLCSASICGHYSLNTINTLWLASCLHLIGKVSCSKKLLCLNVGSWVMSSTCLRMLYLQLDVVGSRVHFQCLLWLFLLVLFLEQFEYAHWSWISFPASPASSTPASSPTAATSAYPSDPGSTRTAKHWWQWGGRGLQHVCLYGRKWHSGDTDSGNATLSTHRGKTVTQALHCWHYHQGHALGASLFFYPANKCGMVTVSISQFCELRRGCYS